jgi:hypothetical protein
MFGKLSIYNGKEITIDLNNHSIKRTEQVLTVTKGKLNLIGKGTIEETSPHYGALVVTGSTKVADENYSAVSVGPDVTLIGWSGIMIDNKSGYGCGVNLDVYGTLIGLEDNSGNNGGGLYINGNIKNKENYPVINIYPGAVIESDGTTYAAGYAKWNIDGATITGTDSALAAKAGIFNITNSELRCTGKNQAPTEGNSNGVNASGAAIQLESNSGYAGDMVINIENSTIISENGYSIYEYLGKGTDTAVNGLTISGDSYVSGVISISEAMEAAEVFEISDGYFTSDPSAYLIAGKVAVDSTKAGYNYMVVDENITAPAEVVVAAPSVSAPQDLEEEDQAAVDELSTALKQSDNMVSGSGLNVAANTKAQENTLTEQSQTVVNALADANITPAVDDKVTIVIQPYMDITIQDMSVAEKTLTLDITPRYKVVATIADLDGGEEIKLDGDNPNAAVVNTTAGAEDPELNITKSVDVTIPLPSGFVADVDSPVFIKHVKSADTTYVYKAEVKEVTTDVFTATFTNPNGFSLFAMSTSTAAAITNDNGTKYYATLKDAINNVQAGETITLMENNAEEIAFTGRDLSFIIAPGAYTFNPDNITAGNNTEVERTGDGASGYTYTFDYTAPSGGGTPATSYAITVADSANGSVAASFNKATAGMTVSLTVNAADGYKLDSLKVTDASGKAVSLKDLGDGKYSFTMPESAVKVAASFVKGEETYLPFDDVAAASWYYEAVKYVYDNDLMAGDGAGSFNPDVKLSRAMIAQVLYNLEGAEGSYSNSFSDVAAGKWYTDAIAWAAANNVVSGDGQGHFFPEQNITRQEMAVILYNYANFKGYDTVPNGNLGAFSDGGKTAAWATDALSWAVGAGVINGANGMVNPTGDASRAEVAQVLQNFCEKVLK